MANFDLAINKLNKTQTPRMRSLQDVTMTYGKKHDHDHLKIANHSPRQQAMFFAIAHQCGFSVAEVKERAIARFRLDCFNRLTTAQLSELIDRLLVVQKRQEEVRRFHGQTE